MAVRPEAGWELKSCVERSKPNGKVSWSIQQDAHQGKGEVAEQEMRQQNRGTLAVLPWLLQSSCVNIVWAGPLP